MSEAGGFISVGCDGSISIFITPITSTAVNDEGSSVVDNDKPGDDDNDDKVDEFNTGADVGKVSKGRGEMDLGDGDDEAIKTDVRSILGLVIALFFPSEILEEDERAELAASFPPPLPPSASLSFIESKNPLGKAGKQMVICIWSLVAVAL